MTTRLHGRILGAAIVAALGFGAAQALAPPAEAAEPAACDPATCNRKCQANGFAGGVCLQNGQCVCYIITP